MAQIVKNVVAYFFLGQSHDSPKFQIDISEKNFGTHFHAGRGPTPQHFCKSGCNPTWVMSLQNFIPLPLKLWPVDVGKTQRGQKNRQRNKLPKVPPKPEDPSFWTIYEWIELGAHYI